MTIVYRVLYILVPTYTIFIILNKGNIQAECGINLITFEILFLLASEDEIRHHIYCMT